MTRRQPPPRARVRECSGRRRYERAGARARARPPVAGRAACGRRRPRLPRSQHARARATPPPPATRERRLLMSAALRRRLAFHVSQNGAFRFVAVCSRRRQFAIARFCRNFCSACCWLIKQPAAEFNMRVARLSTDLARFCSLD